MENDSVLSQWIFDDLAENESLIVMNDSGFELPDDIKETKTLLTKFRIVGKTKKYKKAHRNNIIPTISQKQIHELEKIIAQNKILKDDNSQALKIIDKYKHKIAKLQNSMAEMKKMIKKINSETDEIKQDHLKQIEAEAEIRKREEIEEKRSKKARTTITQRKISKAAELEALTKEEEVLDNEIREFLNKWKKEKSDLQNRIKEAENTHGSLMGELRKLERVLAFNGS